MSALVGLGLGASTAALACDAPGQCRGVIDVRCDGLDDCWCNSGPFAGDSCIYDLESNAPEVCEVKCCEGATAGPSVPGPPSILRGTK